MFLLKNKRTFLGDSVDIKKPELLFYNNPMIVLDTLYEICNTIGENAVFLNIISDFANFKYGKFNDTIQYEVLARTMVLFRELPLKKDYFFKKLLSLIKRTNRRGFNLSSKIKIIINCEIAHHYISFYGNNEKGITSYNRAQKIYDDTMVTIGVRGGNNIIIDNINGVNKKPLHVHSTTDIINPSIHEMYNVLRAGFIINTTEKRTALWFNWSMKNKFKELFIMAIEKYSIMEYPICGKGDIKNAINECILIYTSDPKIVKVRSVESIESKYDVTFNMDTCKFKWYM